MAAQEHADPFDAIVDAIAHLSIGCLLESAMGNVIDAEDGFNYARSAQIENGIRAAVEMLPERDRRIIVDHYYGHLPFSEIAVELGLTRGRVSQLHHAALTKIRNALREF
ncbi:MAG: sigma-70 family RNA polymerase sigma factor [Nitrospira sp.]|nr:sigma-70 family RNA polymerase sigma factor [Nitrospira sp.]